MTGRKKTFPSYCVIELLRAAALFYAFVLAPAPAFGTDMRILCTVLASTQILPALAWIAALRERQSAPFFAWILVPAHSLNLLGIGLRMGYRVFNGMGSFYSQGRLGILAEAFGVLAFFLEIILLLASIVWLVRSSSEETAAVPATGEGV